MRSGIKSTVVSIMRHNGTIDPDYNLPGAGLTAWKTNLFCKSEPRRSQERNGEGQVVGQSIMRFTFDYLDVDGVTMLDVIRLGTSDYVITGLYPDENEKQDYMIEASNRAPVTGVVP